jgi:hypothetical protein
MRSSHRPANWLHHHTPFRRISLPKIPEPVTRQANLFRAITRTAYPPSLDSCHLLNLCDASSGTLLCVSLTTFRLFASIPPSGKHVHYFVKLCFEPFLTTIAFLTRTT